MRVKKQNAKNTPNSNNLIINNENNKKQYDKTMNKIKVHVGDKVLIKNQSLTSSLSPNLLGSYEVIVVNDKVNVKQ